MERKFDALQQNEVISFNTLKYNKKPSFNLDALKKRHDNSCKDLSTLFINATQLLEMNTNEIKFVENQLIPWSEAEKCLKGRLILDDLNNTDVLCYQYYKEDIHNVFDQELKNKAKYVEVAEKNLANLFSSKHTVINEIRHFMRGENIVPSREFEDIMNSYGKYKVSKALLKTKKIRKQPKLTEKIKQKKLTKAKRYDRILKILYEKVALKKQNHRIEKKYRTHSKDIGNLVANLRDGKLDPDKFFSEGTKNVESKLKKCEQYLIDYLNQSRNQIVTLKDIKDHIRVKFPELSGVALSTIWNTLIKLQYKWQSFGLTQPVDREKTIKEYTYYYFKELFKYFQDGCTVVSIDETGLSRKTFKKISKSWMKRGTKNHRGHFSITKTSNWLVAISMEGIVGFTIRYGPHNTFTFFHFIRQLLNELVENRKIRANKIVLIMDNAKFHVSYMPMKWMLNQNVRVLCIPPYTAPCNPVEFSFADFKQGLRKFSILSE